jgi:hypothetical protein
MIVPGLLTGLIRAWAKPAPALTGLRLGKNSWFCSASVFVMPG